MLNRYRVKTILPIFSDIFCHLSPSNQIHDFFPVKLQLYTSFLRAKAKCPLTRAFVLAAEVSNCASPIRDLPNLQYQLDKVYCQWQTILQGQYMGGRNHEIMSSLNALLTSYKLYLLISAQSYGIHSVI